MRDSDKRQFMELMTATMKYYDKDVDTGSMGIYWNGLQDFELADVQNAFGQHIQTNKFMPKVSDVRDMMPDTSGWLSPEEAWNALPKTEYDGGYVTQQIMSAAPFDSLDRGDLIGGRMAFLETYKKLVTEAKAKGESPSWFYSAPTMGDYETKQDIKEQSLLIAKEKQWISPTTYQKYALELDRPISQDNPALQLLQQTASGSKQIGKGLSE